MPTSTTVNRRLKEIEDVKIRDAISRGNLLLTRYFGKDWPDKITTDILDINDCTVCILGQLTGCHNYREWVDECRKLGIYPHLAHEYGLDTHTESWLDDTFEIAKAKLEEGWRKVLG